MMKHIRIIAFPAFVSLLLGAGCGSSVAIDSFEACALAGNPVMESYPRQCRADGKTFVEQVTPLPPLNIAEFNEPFTLEIGKNRPVLGGLRVTLLDIADSRCPKDVVCIWEGELAAHLQIEGPEDTAPVREITLGTVRNKTANVSGFTFALTEATLTSVTLVVTR